MQAFALACVGAAAFALTNIDDLIVLVSFFANPAYKTEQIVAGQFLGIGLLICVSLAGALIAQTIPMIDVGLLGLLPICIGIKSLIYDGATQSGENAFLRGNSKIVTVMLVTVANGADNLSLYIPLFAVHNSEEIALFVLVFAAMTALWCRAGFVLVRTYPLAVPVQRWGARLLPYVLIALGAYVLTKAEL